MNKDQVKRLVQLANELDEKDMQKEADEIDKVVKGQESLPSLLSRFAHDAMDSIDILKRAGYAKLGALIVQNGEILAMIAFDASGGWNAFLKEYEEQYKEGFREYPGGEISEQALDEIPDSIKIYPYETAEKLVLSDTA